MSNCGTMPTAPTAHRDVADRSPAGPDKGSWTLDRDAKAPLKVLFLITALETGGAERQLVNLLGSFDDSVEAHLAVFHAGGGLWRVIDDLPRVKTYLLNASKSWRRRDYLPSMARFVGLARRIRPDVVFSYLPGMHLMALAAGRACRSRVAWSIRASNIEWRDYGIAPQLLFKAEGLLSSRTDLLVANSAAGADHYVKHGYDSRRLIVIPNGIDVDEFKPNREAGEGFRRRMGIREDVFLVGHAARLDPVKDHPTFLRAAELALRERPALRFAVIGGGSEAYACGLREMTRESGISDAFTWTGPIQGMSSAYNAFDIFCMSSRSEGTPNSVAEAMACGVPCVVTDVGDSAILVGETGMVAPPRNPEALAEKILALAGMDRDERAKLAGAARQRILERYSQERLVNSMVEALTEVI